MNKREFLSALEARLSGLPHEDIGRSLDYYSEMIDDRIEEGMSEYEAVRDLGSMDSIVSSIIAETPMKKLVGAQLERKSELKGWHIALLILGAPLWIPLLIALLSVIFAVYITLFSLIFAAFAIVLSFAFSAGACLIEGVRLLLIGSAADGVLALGLALLFAGLTVLLFILSIGFAKLMYKGTKAVTLFIKSWFVRKER